MKTILVPTDFSECSMYALKYAASLARKTKATLHILNIIEKTDYYYSSDPLIAQPVDLMLVNEYIRTMKKISNERLNKLIKEKFLSRLKIKHELVTGHRIYLEIIDYSNKIKADIIIMGTKGSSGIKGILFGSNAERTVRFSERPVMVVNEDVRDNDIKTIVFASDFTKEANLIFPIIKNYAKIYGADIHLLKVNIAEQFRTTRDNTRLMQKFNERFNSKNKIVIYDDYMKEEGILNYAEDARADIIAMGTHGKNGLARFFKSNVSESMVRLTHRPILVVNFSELKHKSDLLTGSGRKERSALNGNHTGTNGSRSNGAAEEGKIKITKLSGGNGTARKTIRKKKKGSSEFFDY